MRYLLYFYIVENLREQILILVSCPIYLIIIGLEVLLSNYRRRDHHADRRNCIDPL